MTIRLKDRRKPWQKACISHKFARCGSMTTKTATEHRHANAKQARQTASRYSTIGELESRGLEADTPLHYRPINIHAIAAE